MNKTNIERLINDFAIRSFRDQADADYISARMAFRAGLVTPALWGSQQMIEKYLKCILLLNRIVGNELYHDLSKSLNAITNSGILSVDLTSATRQFIEHIDMYGKFRYLEISTIAFGSHLIDLDRTAWELRRYCTLDAGLRLIALSKDVTPPKVRISGGYLEEIIDDAKNQAREPLVWRNAFFGGRQRRNIKPLGWIKARNASLYLHPEILDEIQKYVFIPKEAIRAYRRA